MIQSLHFKNYCCFENKLIDFSKFNILTGIGKTTICQAISSRHEIVIKHRLRELFHKFDMLNPAIISSIIDDKHISLKFSIREYSDVEIVNGDPVGIERAELNIDRYDSFEHMGDSLIILPVKDKYPSPYIEDNIELKQQHIASISLEQIKKYLAKIMINDSPQVKELTRIIIDITNDNSIDKILLVGTDIMVSKKDLPMMLLLSSAGSSVEYLVGLFICYFMFIGKTLVVDDFGDILPPSQKQKTFELLYSMARESNTQIILTTNNLSQFTTYNNYDKFTIIEL